MIEITNDQIEVLKKYIDNINELIKSDDINALLLAIDSAMLSTLDENDESTENTVELIKIYDQIFNNN